jgi:hypothetical protein
MQPDAVQVQPVLCQPASLRSWTLFTLARYVFRAMSYIPDFKPEEAEVTIQVESDPEDLQVTLRLHCARPAQHVNT